MGVIIHIPPQLRNYTKNAAVEVNGHTIGTCLQELFRQLPDLQRTVPAAGFQIHKNSIDGERFFSWESDRPVKDGDELILSFISGCC